MSLRSLVSEIRQSVYAVLIQWDQPQINTPKVQVLGTAFSVSEGIFITADHVVNPQNNTPPGIAIGANDKILLAQMQADGSTAVIIGPCQVVASSQLHDYVILKNSTAANRIHKYLELDLGSRFEGEEDSHLWLSSGVHTETSSKWYDYHEYQHSCRCWDYQFPTN